MFTHTTTWLLAGLMWLVLWPDAARGQSPELQEAYDSFEALYAKDYYDEALPFAKKALRLGRQEFGLDHPTTATLLDNLAALYEAQGAYAEAEPLYQRALVIWEKTLGPDHPEVAASLNNLAKLYQAQGAYAEAEPLHKRALAIREKALGTRASKCGRRSCIARITSDGGTTRSRSSTFSATRSDRECR